MKNIKKCLQRNVLYTGACIKLRKLSIIGMHETLFFNVINALLKLKK